MSKTTALTERHGMYVSSPLPLKLVYVCMMSNCIKNFYNTCCANNNCFCYLLHCVVRYSLARRRRCGAPYAPSRCMTAWILQCSPHRDWRWCVLYLHACIQTYIHTHTSLHTYIFAVLSMHSSFFFMLTWPGVYCVCCRTGSVGSLQTWKEFTTPQLRYLSMYVSM